MALASAHEDVEGLVQKITLLEGKFAEEHWAREVVEENSHSLSEVAVDAEHWWVVSKRECKKQFEELTLLQTWSAELCHAIVGPPLVRNQLLEGMQLAAFHHTEMAGELGTHPTRSSTWKLWVSWLLNSRGWRSGAHGMSGLPCGSATCFMV
jgi:hypothetical protein